MKKAEAKKAEALKVLKDYMPELELKAKYNICSEDYKLYMAINIAIEKLEQPEIVHCKDCKHWHEWENGAGSCHRSSIMWVGTDCDDYCSLAKGK